MVCQLRAKERAIFAIQQQNEGNLDAQHEVSTRSIPDSFYLLRVIVKIFINVLLKWFVLAKQLN